MEEVIAAILALKSRQECASFLDAMLTPQELKQFPVRWGLLRMLLRNKISQRKLAQTAGVAPATAARADIAFRRHREMLTNLCARLGEP
jgi:uncharacterized protein YerC